uniref:Integrase core domain containing protein n=1 Tax=Solanum tuberosum TaxID=4113 RepID=M1DEZ4_SOLTU
MRHAIEDSATRVKQQMKKMMDRKVQAVHQRLDVFELWVIDRPAPTTDVSVFLKELASLRADIDTLLTPRETDLESAPTASTNDTMFDALFKDEIQPPTSSHHAGKHPRSSRASNDTEVGRACKRERQ